MLVSPLFLAACGNLPRPFAGRPGAQAVRLATPPVARLAVVSPRFAALDQPHAAIWAGDIADALVAAQMPARVGPPSASDWSVLPSVSRQGGMIVPRYELHDGTGELRGTIDGAPVPEVEWVTAGNDVLRQSAQQAAPKIGDLLTQIETARMAADPNSLMHRAAKVRVLAGKGASGDGDQSLPDEIRIYLKNRGITLTDDAAEADYTLAVDVTIGPADAGNESVQIIWIVTDAQGREAGRVAQLNDVPAHSLDGHWGEVAETVAEQAASGVAEVINNRLPVVAKHPPPNAAPMVAAADNVAVRFASLASEAAAEREWQRLERRAPALLRGRTPQILAVSHESHTRYRLQSGGFASLDDARKFCAAAASARLSCEVAQGR